METRESGLDQVAMDTDIAMEDDEPLPFVITAVRSENPQSAGNGPERSNCEERPRLLGMMLPLAPPAGKGPESEAAGECAGSTQSVVTSIKPSRKVAKKSTAKAAKNLPKPEQAETNNNVVSPDTDLEAKRKQAARRLQEKLKLISKFSSKPEKTSTSPRTDDHVISSSLVKESEKTHVKVKLKLPKPKDPEPRTVIPEEVSTNQEFEQVSPPGGQQKSFHQTSITEFYHIPQHSSTPLADAERQFLKRKRIPDDDVSLGSKDIEDTPKRKTLRSSSINLSPDAQNIKYLKAFMYDGLDKCPSCKTQFINYNSLKKHMRNGHQVLVVREVDNPESVNLDMLNRNELNNFLNSTRPSECRYCKMKYKYLSCVYKHEKTCMSRPAEDDSNAEEYLQEEFNDPLQSFLEEIVGNGVKKYHCLVCSATFADKSEFFCHFDEEHKPSGSSGKKAMKEKKPLILPDVRDQVPDNKPYQKSITVGFSSDPDAFPPIGQGFAKEYRPDGMAFAWRCLVCQMKLSHKSNLKRHYGRHTEYFYKCGNCSLRLKTIKEYRTHKFMCSIKVSKKPAGLLRYPISFGKKKVGALKVSAASQSTALSKKRFTRTRAMPTSAAPRVISTKVHKPVLPAGGVLVRRFEQTSIGPKEGIKKISIGGVTQWKCAICQKKVKYKSTMEKHYTCHFSERREYYCQYCNHKSMDEATHKMHEADCWIISTPEGAPIKTPAEAQQSNGSFKCSICHRVFWHVYNYKRHALKHSGLGAFKCEKCGKRYKGYRKRDNCCPDGSNAEAVGSNGMESKDQKDANAVYIQSDSKNQLSSSIRREMSNNITSEKTEIAHPSRRRQKPAVVAADAKLTQEIPSSNVQPELAKSIVKLTPKEPVDQAVSIKKRKSPMEGLTHGDVMQWARKLLAQSANSPKTAAKKSKPYCLKSQKCPICKRSFTTKSYLRTHLMYHARGPPEDCPHCGRSFIYHSYRERHIENCQGTMAAVENKVNDATVTEDVEMEDVKADISAVSADSVDIVEDNVGGNDVSEAYEMAKEDDKDKVTESEESIQYGPKQSCDREVGKVPCPEVKDGGSAEKPTLYDFSEEDNCDEDIDTFPESRFGKRLVAKQSAEKTRDGDAPVELRSKRLVENPSVEDTGDANSPSGLRNKGLVMEKSRRKVGNVENDSNNNNDSEMKQLNAEDSDVSNMACDSMRASGKGYTKVKIRDRWMYECNMCKRLFREHEVAVMHVKIHDKNSFHCNMCAKSFPTWTQFQRHQIMSHGVRPIEEIESDAESDIVISDSDSDSDEEMYIDMEDDMKPKEVLEETEDVKPVLLKNIKKTQRMSVMSVNKSSSGQVLEVSSQTSNGKPKDPGPGDDEHLDNCEDDEDYDNHEDPDTLGNDDNREDHAIPTDRDDHKDHELHENRKECDDSEITEDHNQPNDNVVDDIADGASPSKNKKQVHASKTDAVAAEKSHIKLKTKKKQFECDFCRKKLACASALYRHRLGHFGAATYRCEQCNLGFVTPKDRNQHNWDFHGIPKPIYGGTAGTPIKSQTESSVPNDKMEVDRNLPQFDDDTKDDENVSKYDGNTSSAFVENEDAPNLSNMTNTQSQREIDTHSPTLTDSSDGSHSSKRWKGYLCPGCHKLIKSETALCSHMNLCIPDQPGSVHKCEKCGDHFMFRAAHIIHQHKCTAEKSQHQEKTDVLPTDDEPTITPTSLRKRSFVCTTPDGSMVSSFGASGMAATTTPPVGSMTEAPTFEMKQFLQPAEDIPPIGDDKRLSSGLSSASDSSIIKTPTKELKESLAAYNKAARGVQPLYCMECNKELKAWSLHKHVNQCCPSKAAMFHTCNICGHSVKTYAGYMIHIQLGCDPNKPIFKPRTSKSLSPGGNETMADLSSPNEQGMEMRELGQAVFMAFQNNDQAARPIGSMEIVSPDGTPIKVEIDYNFNDESFPSYIGPRSSNSAAPSGMGANQISPPDVATEEQRRRYICEHCNKEYRSYSGLDHHMKKCTGHQVVQQGGDENHAGMSLKVNMPNKKPKSGFRCQFCGDTFFHAALLHVHEASHSAKLQQQSDEVLGAMVPQQGQGNTEVSVETLSVPILSCSICGKEFINKQRLQRHERIHLNVKPFKCKLCAKGFGRRDNLRQHEFLVHKIKKSASVDDIDPEFPRIGRGLNRQGQGKAGSSKKYRSAKQKQRVIEKEYNEINDEIMNETADDEGGLDLSSNSRDGNAFSGESFDIGNEAKDANEQMNEYQLMTGNAAGSFTVKQQYQCQLCPITCDSLSAITKHMATHSDDRPYKCDVCNLSFKLMGNLNRHKLTHEGLESPKSFVCPYCDKSYSQKLSLQSHILTHTGERPFQCRFCPKKFGREQILKNHEKTHLAKSYECDICSKKFARNDAMKVHRLHHLTDNQKPHRCDLCDRGFVTRQQLMDHQRSHTVEGSFPCRHCGKTFTTAGGRGLHERLHNAKVVNYSCPNCKVIMHNYGSYKKHVALCLANGPTGADMST